MSTDSASPTMKVVLQAKSCTPTLRVCRVAGVRNERSREGNLNVNVAASNGTFTHPRTDEKIKHIIVF